MTPTPEVEPLPYQRRRLLFGGLFALFFLSLPVFVFYAIGYRFDFSDETGNIVGTGGMYVTAELSEADIYINDEPVNDMRIFRSASYIQNLDQKVHSVTVQADGVHTWAKELPVFPHIVTEAQSFNLPLVPQVRVITEYQTAGNDSVVFVATTSEQILPKASTTNSFSKATSTATSTFRINPEYEFVTTLFASTTATSTGLVDRMIDGVGEAFQFSSEISTTTEEATSTKEWRDVTLFRREEEVFAGWEGSSSDIPYYFCVDHENASTTRVKYGDHVFDAIKPLLQSTSTNYMVNQNGRSSVCREEIRIDRKRQQVRGFDFFPGSTDLVLLLLEDGVYVGEIDDRSWQNTQLLYPGENLLMVLDGGQIYIKDGDVYVEALTSLE